MNIREYYQKTSNSNFHASWISLVLAIVFFICHAFTIIPGNILLITAPFIFLSIAQFVSHRIYENRIKELPIELIETNTSLLQTEHVSEKAGCHAGSADQHGKGYSGTGRCDRSLWAEGKNS